MSDNPFPEGECSCDPSAGAPCAFCHAANLWAHIELYGEDDLGIAEPRRFGGEDFSDWDWDDDE